MKPGVPKPEFSNQRSRDNRTLEQSRLDEATELMSKLTPKLKDALVYARVKEKQEENKSSDDTLTFSSAVGGTPVTVAPNLGARKKLNYEHPKTPKTPVSKKHFKILPMLLICQTGKQNLLLRNLEKVKENSVLNQVLLKKYLVCQKK